MSRWVAEPLSASAALAFGLACGLALGGGAARAGEAGSWRPSRVLIEAGAGDHGAAAVVGLRWDWAWDHVGRWGRFGGQWEAVAGRWFVVDPGLGDRDGVTRFGLTPVLRFWPGAGHWFIEGGIGANALTPLYHNRDERFSTTFQFGDHLGVGWSFGAQREHELIVRLQHFSNGGIRNPNPGENFVELQYSHPL
jgi:hypothetical protein